MAQTSSGALPVGSSYPLGEYSFRLTANYDSRQGVTHVTARCTKGEENASRSLSVPGQVSSWSVEADETEASVYANYHKIGQEKVPQKSFSGCSNVTVYNCNEDTQLFYWSYEYHGSPYTYYPDAIIYSATPQTVTITSSMPLQQGGYTGTYSVTNRNSNGTYWANIDFDDGPVGPTTPIYGPVFTSISDAGESVSAGAAPTINASALVGRFAIDLVPAGGGAGGDWDEPGDDGDPFKTLHVTVIGAHSGRHNDPMGDTSYSYLPADKLTVAGYGCGGDGGHGGGGGAGASTVIIHKFATSRADSKDLTALARGHGYGSGGGKGGKGGDGIILIYYREATP